METRPQENPAVENGRPGSAPSDEIAPVLEQIADAPRDLAQAKLILEAALLSSSEPLQLTDLKKLFDQELSAEVIRKLLDELRGDWSDRAVELTPVASGWRFRVRPEFAQFVQRMNPEKPPRYSRAVLETLAIIAYKQPATRGDIEQIRGVTVSPQILKTLEERGWIEAVGQREVPGRPALFATTRRFLDDLNLRSLEELPALNELQATLDMTTVDAVPARAESVSSMEASGTAPAAETTTAPETIETTTETATTKETTTRSAEIAIAEIAIVEVEPVPAPYEATHDPEETQSHPPTAE